MIRVSAGLAAVLVLCSAFAGVNAHTSRASSVLPGLPTPTATPTHSYRLAIPGMASDRPAPPPPPPPVVPARCAATRSPAGSNLRPAAEDSIFQGCQVIAYYGYPGIPGLGILGAADPGTVAQQLEGVAAGYDATNGDRGVVIVFHLIAAVAQGSRTADGTWLVRMPDSLIEQYIAAAEQYDGIVILDVQMAHSTVDAEIPPLLHYLDNPRVHLAVDPEWAMPDGVAPGSIIGGMDASAINRAQELMDNYIDEHKLSNRMLIVHQFVPQMIRSKAVLQQFANVDLVIDTDGFGYPQQKIDNYNRYIGAEGAPHGGMKLFYQQDIGLMSPAEVNALVPQPDFIVYQ